MLVEEWKKIRHEQLSTAVNNKATRISNLVAETSVQIADNISSSSINTSFFYFWLPRFARSLSLISASSRMLSWIYSFPSSPCKHSPRIILIEVIVIPRERLWNVFLLWRVHFCLLIFFHYAPFSGHTRTSCFEKHVFSFQSSSLSHCHLYQQVRNQVWSVKVVLVKHFHIQYSI